MDATIRLQSLSQGYGKRTVIRDLNLVLGRGAFGILGPNGAGKTTLLRTMATITPPRSGTLEIAGVVVESERGARLARRHIGYLPQNFGFYPSFSVYDFIRYVAWLREVPSAMAHKSTLQVIDNVGLGGQHKSRMRSLSGGMARRAGIAAALVGSPQLVLLDEPTVGLDPAQRLEFRELIRSLSGTTVVLSTHLVEDISAICQDVAVIADGSFRFRGTPAELEDRTTTTSPGDTALERGYMSVIDRI